MTKRAWLIGFLAGLSAPATAEEIDRDAQEVLWSVAEVVCQDPYAFTLVPGVFHGYTLDDNQRFFGPNVGLARAGDVPVTSWRRWGQFGGTKDRQRRSSTNLIVYCRTADREVAPFGVSVVRPSRRLIADMGTSADGSTADDWRHRSIQFCVIGERAALIRRRDVGRFSLVVSAPNTALLVDVAGGRRLWKSLCVDE